MTRNLKTVHTAAILLWSEVVVFTADGNSAISRAHYASGVSPRYSLCEQCGSTASFFEMRVR